MFALDVNINKIPLEMEPSKERKRMYFFVRFDIKIKIISI